MLQIEDQPILVCAAVGRLGDYYPVVFQRENGFEPGHIVKLDGSRWIAEVPYRCKTLAQAAEFSSLQCLSVEAH